MLTTRAEVFEMLGISLTATEGDRALFQLIHRPAEACLMSWLNRESLAYQQHVEYLPQGSVSDREVDFHLSTAERIGDSVHLSPIGPAPATLQLAHRPVWNYSMEVREDTGANAGQATDAFNSDTILTQGTDYWLDVTGEGVLDGSSTLISATGLVRHSSAWPSEPRSVKVTYYGGETVTRLAQNMANLKWAALLTVVASFRTAEEIQGGTEGAVSESIGKYSYSRDGSAAKQYSMQQFSVPPEAQRAAMPAKNMRVFG